MRENAKGCFLDLGVPDLSLHGAPRGTGSLKPEEQLEVSLVCWILSAPCLVVVNVADDGDGSGGTHHGQPFESYASATAASRWRRS
jgi:hypothetical protein